MIVRRNVVSTNCHVVDSYGNIVIYKHNNRRATTDTTLNAVVIHRDDDRDFCLLKVVGLKGKPAKVRRYQTLKIGEDVYAVGSPKGLDLSLSSGIISQLRRGTSARYIQTDAAISPGSSGGGLFDSDGNMVGILTRKIADKEVEGIGFAIPAEVVLGFLISLSILTNKTEKTNEHQLKTLMTCISERLSLLSLPCCMA